MLVGHLQGLENYKSVCEKKIMKLIPTQRLAKNMEMTMGNEINVLRGEIERLNEENSQLKLVVSESFSRNLITEKENTTLKEQQNYIKMLKDAVEAKIDKLGIHELLAKNADIDPVEQFAKLVLIQNNIENKQAEMKKNELEISEMEQLVLELKQVIENQGKELEQLHIEHAEMLKKKNQVEINYNELSEKVSWMLFIVCSIEKG